MGKQQHSHQFVFVFEDGTTERLPGSKLSAPVVFQERGLILNPPFDDVVIGGNMAKLADGHVEETRIRVMPDRLEKLHD